MRILAVDLGDVRTGLAAGEDLTGTVQPLEVIVERDPERRFEKIVAAADAFGPDLVLIGLPINMDDTEGPRALA
ncbi:MAG: Holliday junction resolvase RuvX, partial [Phycisphaera sp.]|nr:Holliday junction resolvase RuvX [Phycisphaera sp.]